MFVRRLHSLSIALLAAGGVSVAWAQGSGTWIDPPAQLPPAAAQPQETAPPRSPAPAPQTATPSQPRAIPEVEAHTEPAPRTRAAEPQVRTPERPRRTAEPPRTVAPVPSPSIAERRAPERRGAPSRVAAAEALAARYLHTWSAPNELTLERTTAFYAPRVRFHGRLMSARQLLEEKRRFVRRWPERNYRPRLSTMGAACAPRGATCTVRSVFDFEAANPSSGRRSQGIGTLEIVVSFAGERPVITAENSVVLARGREQRAARQETGNE